MTLSALFASFAKLRSAETLPETKFHNMYPLLYMGIGFSGSVSAERQNGRTAEPAYQVMGDPSSTPAC